MSTEKPNNATPESMPRRGLGFSEATAVILTGLSIGWLVGLSRSPVVAASIATLFALAGTMLAALRDTGPQTTSLLRHRATSAWPVALLALTVAVGASAGNFARTNDLLGKTAATKERERQELESGKGGDPTEKTGLFADASEECAELLASSPRTIRTVFRSARSADVRRLGERIEDPDVLAMIAKALCSD